MADAPRKLELSPGDVLGAQAQDGHSAYFEVTRPLSSGGQGVIYEAVSDDGQFAIVKGPLHVGKRDLSLEREAQHLATVSPHGNVIRLLGTQKDPRGHTLLFLERVFENPFRVLNRDAIRARLEARAAASTASAAPQKPRAFAPPPSVALELGYELALALEHLHAKGLVHGDVKPANVLVAIDWREPEIPDHVYFDRLVKGRWRGVLIDLGGARTTKELDALARGLPIVKPPSMTPAFAPPEVLPGAVEPTTGHEKTRFSAAMDVYAFGLTLYSVLTGQSPYAHLQSPPDDTNLAELARCKRDERNGAHRPISRAALDAIDWTDCSLEGPKTATDRRGFVEEVWAFLARATHVEPTQRFRAADLRGALGKLLRVEDLTVEAAASLRNAADDDPRTVRPWAQHRLRLDSFASRLVDAGRDGSTTKQDPRTRKIQRGGQDFWEMQGFAPK